MNIKELNSNEIMPGFHGRIIHGSDFTWAYWEIEKGANLPEHNHINEQLMHVIEGEFEFTIDGKKNICTNGSTFLIPSNFWDCIKTFFNENRKEIFTNN